MSDARVRSGAILLECLLALAIFVGGAVTVLALVDRSIGDMGRVRETRTAADLAKSAMARIEAGDATAEALAGRVREDGTEDDAADGDAYWELEIGTAPTAFQGLTRVAVRAVKREGSAVSAEFELVQLVARREREPARTAGAPDP